MAKSLVERYEQILAQDPTSSVFVELAKALLEKGDAARAIEVCQAGIGHHPGSVAARVLWGKALIQLGRPAEAMEQFDQAIGIDKENPHAYNLISEVLLQKGLYRSAVPILRKASALQPNDARVRSWLEQTQRALAGGPAPQLSELSLSAPTEPSPEPAASAASAAHARGVEEPFAPPVLAPVDGAGAPPVLTPVDGSAGGPPVLISVDAPAAVARRPAARGAGEPGTGDEPPAPAPSAGGGLLGDIGLPEDEPLAPAPKPIEVTSFEPGRAPVVRAVGPRRGGGLLGDLPELAEPAAPPAEAANARGALTTQATRVLADEYEKQLREKLAAEAAKPKSFLARNWVAVSVSVVVLAALGAALGAYLTTRAKYRGEGLADALVRAKKAIAQDTAASYREARGALEQAIDMEESSVEAWALTAYTHAMLFAEHGRSAEDRARVEEALARSGVEPFRPGLALAARFQIADGGRRDELRRAVLSSKEADSELHELAGRLLLQKGDARAAVERFKQALTLSSRNVRALVALGDYYREAGDHGAALTFYETATQLSPGHVAGVIGMAESRLEQEQDTSGSLAAMAALPPGDSLSPELWARKDLVHGRLLSDAGQHDAAVKKLTEGSRAFRAQAFEYQLALGEANRAAGNFEGAQRAFEAAVKLRGRSAEARAALARVLVDRDREREMLSRFADGDERKVALVRGIAHGKLGDWKKARAELVRTETNGRYPSEAVIWLTLADAAEGNPEKAQAVLEKALATTKKNKSEVRVALGKVYLQRGLLDRARAQFESAIEDRKDFEGACQLGQLLLSLGEVDAAVGPLKTSVARNGSHGESRHALSRALLAQGQYADALKQAQDWILDNPASAVAQKDFALALLHQGKLKDAQAAIDRAVKAAPRDAEAHRIRAQALFARGESRAAFAALQASNRLNPADPETFCEIGRGFLRQGEPDKAEAAFEAATRSDPKSACGAIGVLQAQLPGGGRQAAARLQTLAAKAPNAFDRGVASAVRARALLQLGAAQLDDARASAEQAVRLAPGAAQASYALGLVAQRQKNADEAIAAFTRAVELDGADPALRLALADELERASQTEKAIAAYEAFLRLDGDAGEQERVTKLLPDLKKKLAAR